MIGWEKVMVKWKQVRRLAVAAVKHLRIGIASSFSTPLNSSLQERGKSSCAPLLRAGPVCSFINWTKALHRSCYNMPSVVVIAETDVAIWTVAMAVAVVASHNPTLIICVFWWFIVHKLDTPRRIVAEDAFFKYH